jgi:hypothetical protein
VGTSGAALAARRGATLVARRFVLVPAGWRPVVLRLVVVRPVVLRRRPGMVDLPLVLGHGKRRQRQSV